MDRRTTIKWVLAAGAAWPLRPASTAQANSAASAASSAVPSAAPSTAPVARGYGTDPDLAVNYHPGGPWPLTLTADQRVLAGILCDIILPADDHSPSASAVGVVDFIDEWVSAPYPTFQRDRGVVMGGLIWLDEESERRFGRNFSSLDPAERHGICDDICELSRAPKALRDPAHFFALYRDLTAGGFYSSPAGRKDLNYIGNVPLTNFGGPPPALLKSLGLS
jgi:hypothetical protein